MSTVILLVRVYSDSSYPPHLLGSGKIGDVSILMTMGLTCDLHSLSTKEGIRVYKGHGCQRNLSEGFGP